MNPLGALRTHQRVLLAVFGVLLMVSFTIIPVITNYLYDQPVQRSGNDVAVTWDGGQLSEAELQGHRLRRKQMETFFQLIRQTALQRGVTNAPDISFASDDESILQAVMLAQKARELGLTISDDVVIEFIDGLSEGSVARDELADFIRQLPGGISQEQMVAQVKNALLAQQAMNFITSGIHPSDANGMMFPATPAIAWENFRKLRLGVEADVMAIDVKQYIARVADPTDAEIQAAFERHKNQLPSPVSPEPGFKFPRRLGFEFVKGDFGKFLEVAKKEVTDQAVQEYYDANQSEFKMPELPRGSGISSDDLDPATTPNEGTAAPATNTPATDTPATEPPSTEAPTTENPATEAPATEAPATEAPTSEAPPAAETPASEAPATEAPATEAPAGTPAETPTETPAEGAPTTPPSENQSSRNYGVAPARYVTAQAPEAESPTIPPGSDPINLDAASDAPTSTGTATDEGSAGGSPTGDASATSGASAAGSSTGTPSTDATTSTDFGAPGEAALGSSIQPLEKVSDQIREQLARPIAQKRFDEAQAAVRNAMNSYTQEYIQWEMAQELKKEAAPELKKFELEKIATAQGLEYGLIPPSDMNEIRQYELGQAMNFGITPQGSFTQTSFAEIAYVPSFGMYTPTEILGLDPNVRFLFWKTKEEPERVPTLQEARDLVVTALKLQKARETARDFAQKDAEAVRKAGQPLTEVFGTTRTVTPTGEITWLSSGSTPMGNSLPRMTVVPGVEYAGEDFMKAVFDAQPGDVVVAANHPQTSYFVVQIKRNTVELDKLREQFMQSVTTYVPLRQLTMIMAQGSVRDWVTEFRTSNHVSWRRPPLNPQS